MSGEGGKFLTNKWLIGVLLTIIMSMGGYIFQGSSKASDVQAAQIIQFDRRMTAMEIEIAAATAERRVYQTEIIRRLDRMESAIYGNLRYRSQAP